MALVDIELKNPDGELTNVEFNQLLYALKFGTVDIKTLDLQASTATFTGLVNFLGDVVIGGQSGPYEKYWEGSNILFVGKHGDAFDPAYFDGTSPGRAINNFTEAITYASTAVTGSLSATNRVTIVCLDAGEYEEGLNVPNFVSIFAPSATLKLGGVSNKQLIINRSSVMFNKIYRASGNNDMITFSGLSNTGHLDAQIVMDSSAATAVSSSTSTALTYINIKRLAVLGGGIGITDDSADAIVHAKVGSLYLGSIGATGIYKANGGCINGFVECISTEENDFAGTTAIQVDDGTVNLSSTRIDAESAYEVGVNGEFHLYVNFLEGTETNNGIANVVTPQRFHQVQIDVENKEDYLDNPATDGEVLKSLVNGTRYWEIAGDMRAAMYDPNSVQSDAFALENMAGIYLDMDTDIGVAPAVKEGRLFWNDKDHTLSIDTGLGPVIQAGQEQLFMVYNNSGENIANGKVVRTTASFSQGNIPDIEYAQANYFDKVSNYVFISTHDIPDQSFGFVTRSGKVHGADTSGYSVGSCWVSPDTPGELTNTRPSFPDYIIQIGAVTIVDPVDGEIIVAIDDTEQDTILSFFSGSIRENLNFVVTSNGTTIVGYLSRTDGGDLTMIFPSGFYRLTADPAIPIAMTAGTNNVPIKNYVYIPESTKTLTVSTIGWPTTSHIRIADVVLQSASNTQTYGAMFVRNWNDNLADSAPGEGGDLVHISRWIRSRPASWYSGVEGSVTVVAPTALYYTNTSGRVFQKHLQTFDAIDQQAGDVLFVPNHPTTPYNTNTNLAALNIDANGAALNGRYYNLVVWGSNNKSTLPDQVFVNLPEGSYGSLANAIADLNNYDVYNIPQIFSGGGFLIARFTLFLSNPGTAFTLQNTTDLRGLLAVGGGGGTGSTGATTFLALNDTPLSFIGEANKIVKVDPTETALEFVSGASGTFTTADAKTVTVTNGIITSIV